MPTASLASWLLTFLLHSTLLGAAALIAAWLMRRPEARAVILRGALLGAVATATLVSSVGLGPSIGLASSEVNRGRTIALRADGGVASTSARATARSTSTTPAASSTRPLATRDIPDAAESAGQPARSLELALALALIVAVGVGLARCLRVTLLARAQLARRRPLARSALQPTHGARVAALLAELDAPRAVRVSVARELDVPLALGRAELVLPVRALVELDTDELRALLAHELAHLARRDPLWLGAARLVHAVTWFQPLQRVLLRRLEDESELATDASAVARTGQPLALARTLERVARWISAVPTPTLGVAMARRGATVLTRIERLVALRDVSAPRTTRRVTCATLSTIALVACVAPGCTTDAPVGASGAEAFALLAPVIALAEESDKPIWKHATSDAVVLDFGERPWRASAPQLVLHIGHDAEHSKRPPIHAFGQRLEDADAAAELARLAKDRCPTLYVLVAPTPEASERSIDELQRALARVDLAESQAVVRHDLAVGRRIDALRSGLHGEDAPVRVTLYGGPDAEPNEQRWILRLDERGDLRGLPSGQVPFDFVSGQLRAARTGPFDPTALGPQLEVIQDRVLIECDAATPFEAVLHWLAALAGTNVGVWKTELALAGASDADIVSVFLPRDVGAVSQARTELRVDRDSEGLSYRMISKSGEALETRDGAALIERAFRQDTDATLDLRPPISFGEALPLIRAARERGTSVSFVGAFTRSPLHEQKD
jgi:beta-lactamase regulating signal transducer with metallopeptidase domain